MEVRNKDAGSSVSVCISLLRSWLQWWKTDPCLSEAGVSWSEMDPSHERFPYADGEKGRTTGASAGDLQADPISNE